MLADGHTVILIALIASTSLVTRGPNDAFQDQRAIQEDVRLVGSFTLQKRRHYDR